MSISYTFKKKRVYVDNNINGYSDVISKVEWEIIFTDGNFESIAAGETFLDLTNLEPFTPTDQVTDEKLEEWLFEQELSRNWTEFYAFHVHNIERQSRTASLTLYYSDEDTDDGF